jgi:hypothetical protein
MPQHRFQAVVASNPCQIDVDFGPIVVGSLIAGGLSTPFRDASAGVMVLSAVVHLDWLDGAA